jgi:hypothetical protein
MPLRINNFQFLWLTYKNWHEEFCHDSVSGRRVVEPDRSWGPNPASNISYTPREFFNLIWDFTEFRDPVLIVTKKLIGEIAKNMDEYCYDEDPNRYKETYDKLIIQAKEFECLKD